MKITIEIESNCLTREEQERINTNIENLLARHKIKTRRIGWKGK